MAKRSPSIREFRSKVARLKKAGLTSVDARKASPKSGYLRGLVRKYSDVIEGNAVAVKIKGGKRVVASDIATRRRLSRAAIIAREHQGRAKSGRVIVASSGAPISYSKKNQRFETTVTRNGKRVRAVVAPSNADFRELQKQGFVFQVPFARSGGRVDFQTFDDAVRMEEFMNKYAVPREGYGRKPYSDWREHVVIVPPEGIV